MRELIDDAASDFLAASEWGDAAISPVAGDASSRSYFRLLRGDRRAVLMIAPPSAETSACPVDATPAERVALGYNAAARLAGPNLSAFTSIAATLRACGLSAPEVYQFDAQRGLAIIEDLGDDIVARIATPANEEAIYKTAISVLIHLFRSQPAPPANSSYIMQSYDTTALLTEVELLIDWYWPLKRNSVAPDAVRSEFMTKAAIVVDGLSDMKSLVHRDYHAENLLWLSDRETIARVGLIDFQDGLVGPPAYDLVSLLEDARRDVDPAFAEAAIGYFCREAASIRTFDQAMFLQDYAILAFQRNAKILGIFARLAERDGKTRYLDLLPRVENHMRRDLRRPELVEMKTLFGDMFPELTS